MKTLRRLAHVQPGQPVRQVPWPLKAANPVTDFNAAFVASKSRQKIYRALLILTARIVASSSIMAIQGNNSFPNANQLNTLQRSVLFYTGFQRCGRKKSPTKYCGNINLLCYRLLNPNGIACCHARLTVPLPWQQFVLKRPLRFTVICNANTFRHSYLKRLILHLFL